MAETQAERNFNFNLGGRALIVVHGYEAAAFLNAVITADIAALPEKELRPAALLSPQGKILFEFLLARLAAQGGERPFQIDIAADSAAEFEKRLAFYKLGREIKITPFRRVTAHISSAEEAGSWRDMRFPAEAPIWRSYGEAEAAAAQDARKWDLLRLKYGIAESGRDFALGEDFPHNVNYDLLGAVALHKGCYIGQEIVSRMQHKADIRKRLVRAEAAAGAALPAEGTNISAGGKIIGRLGTVCGGQALALIRLDKLAEAGGEAEAGGVKLSFRPQDIAAVSSKLA